MASGRWPATSAQQRDQVEPIDPGKAVCRHYGGWERAVAASCLQDAPSRRFAGPLGDAGSTEQGCKVMWSAGEGRGLQKSVR